MYACMQACRQENKSGSANMNTRVAIGMGDDEGFFPAVVFAFSFSFSACDGFDDTGGGGVGVEAADEEDLPDLPPFPFCMMREALYEN